MFYVHAVLIVAAGVSLFLAGHWSGVGVVWDTLRCQGGRWPLDGKPPRSCGASFCLCIMLFLVFTIAAIATR